MTHDRRSVLAAFGLVFPLGLTGRAQAAHRSPAPALRLRQFEEAVLETFGALPPYGTDGPSEGFPCRRIEVGHSDAVAAGLQGCHNAHSFAGYPAGHLRIVRTGSAPGPIVGGVRLYVATVDVALTGGVVTGESRPLDFATVPPAPVLMDGVPAPTHESTEGSQEKSPEILVRPRASKVSPLFPNAVAE